MGNFFFLMCFGLFCMFVQSNLLLQGLVSPFRLDLTIPLTLYVTLSERPFRAGLLVVWVGFLVDVFSGSVLGMYTFLRAFMFFLILILKRGLFWENKILFGLLVLTLFFLEALLVAFIFTVTGKHFFGLMKLLELYFVDGIFTITAWYLIYFCYSKLDKKIFKA